LQVDKQCSIIHDLFYDMVHIHDTLHSYIWYFACKKIWYCTNKYSWWFLCKNISSSMRGLCHVW
jgi:hypothetical protein